jgi:hypothetical protein
MRQTEKQKSSNKNARIKVRKLMRPDRELKNSEAGKVRGGGGVSGGVLGDKGNAGVYRPEQ